MLGAIGGFNPLAMLGGMAATKAIDAVTSLFAAEAPQTGQLQQLTFDKDQLEQFRLDAAAIRDTDQMRLAWFNEENPTAQNWGDMDAQQRSLLEESIRRKTEDHVRAMTGKTSGGLVNLVA